MRIFTFFLLLYSSGYAFAEAFSEDYPYLEALYRDLHSQPELSFQEEKTAKRIASELANAGFTVTRNVGGHGLVGVFKNGKGPTIMLRTDLDALPVVEKTGLEYASKVKVIDENGKSVGTMHACAHDIHMTVFTGTARRLIAQKSQWKGTLIMIGQPAEERGAGARAMIEDGLFIRFPRPDYVLGLHASAGLPAGKIATVEGYAMAGVDTVDIRVRGIGGHGAYPQATKDPVVLSAQIINALQTLVSREIAPTEAGVITVGSIHGGTKHNIISEQVDLQLTVRSYTDHTRSILLNGIKRIARGQAQSFGIPEDKWPVVTVKETFTPALYNNPVLMRRIKSLLSSHLGEGRIVQGAPVMGGEDFARYGREEPRIPTAFLWLGAVDPEKYQKSLNSDVTLPSLHSPYFAPLPEPTIKTGVEAMSHATISLFNGRGE